MQARTRLSGIHLSFVDLFQDDFHASFKMFPHQSLDQSRIFPLHPFDHPAVVVKGVFEAVFGLNQGGSVSVKIVTVVTDHLDQFSALGGFVENVMKFGVKLDDLVEIPNIQGLLRFLDFLFKKGKLLRSDVNGGKVGRIAFQGASEFRRSPPRPRE